ncbi:hypothetical protein UlMin_022612 [Ulmus minor]
MIRRDFTLQLIDNIRKSPVGAQIKRVIDLLLETRQALTPEQINEACYVDLSTNKAVFDSLRHNPKVKLTRDMIDMEKELQKNGMKPATNTAQRRALAQIQSIPAKIKTKKKERHINKRTKLTNAHLP